MNSFNRILFVIVAILALSSLNACDSQKFDIGEYESQDAASSAADSQATVTNVVNGSDASTSTDATSADAASVDTSAAATPVNCEDKDGDKYCPPVDCDDNNPNVHPGATDTCATIGVDDNCDGKTDVGLTETVYLDKDKDGFGLSTDATTICLGAEIPTDYSLKGGDCNDSIDDKNTDGKVDGFWINPAVTETCGDGMDNNCADGTDEGCAPEVKDLKTGDNFSILVVWPSDKVGQKSMAVESYSDLDVDIGAAFDIFEASANYVAFLLIPDGNACNVRFNTAYGKPAKEWLCMDDKINPNAAIFVVRMDGSSINVTNLVTKWSAPEGGCSVLLKLHDCK